MLDRQQEPPAGWCAWCGREVYPREEVWQPEGVTLHNDCVGEYARHIWPHRYLGVEEGALE